MKQYRQHNIIDYIPSQQSMLADDVIMKFDEYGDYDLFRLFFDIKNHIDKEFICLLD